MNTISKGCEFLYNYCIDENTKTLQLIGDVDETLLKNTMAGLFYLDHLSIRKPITIQLYSMGGNVKAGLAIYDFIRHCKSTVKIIGYGAVESMAVTILQAADRGGRMLSEHARLLLHRGTYELDAEDAANIERKVNELKNVGIIADKIIADAMNINVKEFQKRFERDTYIDAKTAIDLGIADSIYYGRVN